MIRGSLVIMRGRFPFIKTELAHYAFSRPDDFREYAALLKDLQAQLEIEMAKFQEWKKEHEGEIKARGASAT